MSKHALLSPSASERWLICTPCAVLESTIPQEPPTVYAQEGTAAHAYGELCLGILKQYWKPNADLSEFYNKIPKLESYYKLTKRKGWNDEIPETVWNGYVLPVWNATEMTKAKGDEVDIRIEEKLTLAEGSFKDIELPVTFGFADFLYYRNGVVHIYDLKYGKGLAVTANENSQMYLYGAMALAKYPNAIDVSINVVQPRIYTLPSTIVLSRLEMEAWLRSISPNAMKASKGEGEFISGEHCRWCRAKAICPTVNQRITELKEYDASVEDKAELAIQDKKALEAYKMIPVFEDYIEKLKEYMLTRAKEGVEFEGYELKDGNNKYSWDDPEKVIDKLNKAGYNEQQYKTEPKLKSVSQIKTMLGKKGFNFSVGENVITEKGNPVLKKRPIYTIQDFLNEN